MSTINIKFNKPFRSIQTGFEWSNVPMLAIITGVNGAGKTHLIDTLNQSSQNKYTTITEVNSSETRLVLPQNSNNFSYDGLVHYFNDMPNRLNQEKVQLQAINSLKQQIQQREEQYKTATSGMSKRQLQQQISELQNRIVNAENILGSLYIYPYEEELKRIASLKEDVKLEELTIKDIEEHATREFAKITEIEDLSRYVFDIEHQIALRTLDKHSQGNLQGAGEEYNRERVYEKINRLFIKYGFDYFVMPDPFSFDDNKNMLLGRPQATQQSNRGNPQTIKIRFKGRREEIVEYKELSKGEQMIVKFTVWAMAKDKNGMQINTMLLDEPDAHLHPSMCKMMIDILTELSNPKSEGGSAIRIIMTTHSPSTVAFAPDGSLFVMEKDDDGIRSIRNTSNSEAMYVLSDGIFTFAEFNL